ncbi:ABC1 kinase family protein [Saccharopolyspora sp. CA-218241]|uniref:ABC1 kinase family protein n=1 Tax=Saccharopolyspora sp. CA-218241 TaxID=3240027 RepID=UPI003D96D0A9
MTTSEVSAPIADRIRAALPRRAFRVLALGVAHLVPAAVAALLLAVVRGRDAARSCAYRRLTALLVRLGPTFIKAGQVLGTRRDVLPPALCDELSSLQDSAAPMDLVQTRRALVEAYGTAHPPDFARIDHRPVAAGSVACVYRGELRTGEVVALKLRRPDVARTMTEDLALVRRGAGIVARLPVFRGLPVVEVVGSMSDAVLGQLDFVRESENLRRLRENLSVVPRVWVPKVHVEQSRPRCIVMEFVPDLDAQAAQRCSPAARRRFAASGLAAIYQMIFVDGFVHCDMHPGNLYFTASSQVVVLDAGFSVRLSERLRRLFAEFFMNMSTGNGDKCAEIVVRSAAGTGPEADLDGFLRRMSDLVRRSHGLPARDFSLIAFAGEMFDLQRRFGVHAAPELIFPLLSLLVIEGTIRDLDPGMDFQEAAKPILMRGLFGAK